MLKHGTTDLTTQVIASVFSSRMHYTRLGGEVGVLEGDQSAAALAAVFAANTAAGLTVGGAPTTRATCAVGWLEATTTTRFIRNAHVLPLKDVAITESFLAIFRRQILLRPSLRLKRIHVLDNQELTGTTFCCKLQEVVSNQQFQGPLKLEQYSFKNHGDRFCPVRIGLLDPFLTNFLYLISGVQS